jgi:NAD+ synthase
MRELQQRIIEEMGVRPEIDPAEEVHRRVRFLADYLQSTGAAGFVLGISGGVDSTTAGRLAQLAVEKARAELGVTDAVATGATELRGKTVQTPHGGQAPTPTAETLPKPSRQNPQFTAVRLPYNVQADEAEAQQAMDFIAADVESTLNIAAGVDGVAEAFTEATGEPITDYNKGNVKARVRMVSQYALAGQHGQLVVGTDHGAESVTGFFTKFGDGGADVLPLFGLNKRQVRLVAKELGAPEVLWAKVPTADLLDGNPGRADEDELGLSYEHIDDYLEGREVPEAVAEKIEAIWLRSRHKRTTPVTILQDWWR